MFIVCTTNKNSEDFFLSSNSKKNFFVCLVYSQKKMPYLIITNGSTGSGKSSLVDKVIRHCRLERAYKKFLIDDVVENNEEFKQGVDAIITQVCKTRQLCPELRAKLKHPDEDTIQKFNELYFSVRDGTFCAGGKKCSDWLDDDLFEAIRTNENIVFETTGQKYVGWLLDKLPPEYNVLYSFTLVDFCDNLQRNKSRAEVSMEQYVEDRRRPAPRLPDLRERQFAENMDRMLKTLGELLVQCMVKMNKQRVLVHYNVGKSTQFIFDSERQESTLPTVALIERLIQERNC